MAKQWRKESIEEMNHADRFTDRILFLDGFPNMRYSTCCGSARTSRKSWNAISPPRRCVLLYQEAATYCHAVKDYVSRDLFESIMKDEEHHIDFLETQIDRRTHRSPALRTEACRPYRRRQLPRAARAELVHSN